MSSNSVLTILVVMTTMMHVSKAIFFRDKNVVITDQDYSHLKRKDDKKCDDWVHYSNSLATGGEIFIKVGDGLNLEQCKVACLEAQSNYGFFCAATLMRFHTCFMTGYHLRDNYWATHFYRTCKLGPRCFKEESGTSIKTTHAVRIPNPFDWARYTRTLFCMAECEKNEACIGFDLNDRGNKKSLCYLVEVGVLSNSNYDLYLRRCS